jgi:hypothetical protein
LREGFRRKFRRFALVYLVARSTIAFIWLYHGLVPKLLYHDPIELDLLSRIGTPGSRLQVAVTRRRVG